MLSMPPATTRALRGLGENLAIARVRRRESLRAWAKRLGVSIPTLIRMERGDPGVGVGIYATALWLIGKAVKLATMLQSKLLGELAGVAKSQGQRQVVVWMKRGVFV